MEIKTKEEKGFSMYIVLIFTAVIFLIISSVSFLSFRNLSTTEVETESQKAFYAAESGMECAMLIYKEKADLGFWLESTDVHCGSESVFIWGGFESFSGFPLPFTVYFGDEDEGDSRSCAYVEIKEEGDYVEFTSQGYNNCESRDVQRTIFAERERDEVEIVGFDIVLNLDVSGSMGWCLESSSSDCEGYDTRLPWLIDGAELFVEEMFSEEEGYENVRIGLVFFETFAKRLIYLTDDEELVLDEIDKLGLRDPYGVTNTAGGFLVSNKGVLNHSEFYDPDTPNYMVTITDGEPTTTAGPIREDCYRIEGAAYCSNGTVDEEDCPSVQWGEINGGDSFPEAWADGKEKADDAKNNGIVMVTVGVGVGGEESTANKWLRDDIASKRDGEALHYVVDDFGDFVDFVEDTFTKEFFVELSKVYFEER